MCLTVLQLNVQRLYSAVMNPQTHNDSSAVKRETAVAQQHDRLSIESSLTSGEYSAMPMEWRAGLTTPDGRSTSTRTVTSRRRVLGRGEARHAMSSDRKSRLYLLRWRNKETKRQQVRPECRLCIGANPTRNAAQTRERLDLLPLARCACST